MKRNLYITLLLALAILITSCSRNVYSGSGKGSNCGCPSKKGMVGY